ncbi:MAG TPA: hypothetical protein PLZ84_00455, partial [Clostridia bacterium]|nr:hypothetical protein [Clostridia bacterium]
MSDFINEQNLYCNTASREGSVSSFSELAEELASFPGVVAGVFWDSHFEGKETPEGFTYAQIKSAWESLGNVRVVPLDVNQIRSYSILFKGKMDILVFPYGSIFPMDAVGFYTSQTFMHYIRRGGAVLTTGGIPFSVHAGPDGSCIEAKSDSEMIDIYDKWTSKFGIKYYECAVAPSIQRADTRFLPSCEGLNIGPSKYGVLINNSSHEPVPRPPHGNVFPERYPARQVIPLITGYDRYGARVSTTAVMSQDFEDGSRRIHFSHESPVHPLSPANKQFKEFMADIFRLLDNKIFAKEIKSQYACYYDGEKVDITAEIISFEQVTADAKLVMSISDDSGVVYSQTRDIAVSPGESCVHWSWIPDQFEDDEYFISLSIIRQGQTVSYTQNGFVVWKRDITSTEPAIGIRNQYFSFGGKGTFITGTNYYESTRGEIMWYKPNTSNIINDYRSMAASGVNMNRPHYHHLKWFRDYLIYHHGKLLPYYAELEDYTDVMPDERVWRIWDLFIYLSHKYKIAYNGDLFTLVPEEMGDPRGWFGTTEAVYDKNKRKAQKEFLRALEKRYQGLPMITWDLFNEPYAIPDSDVAAWAKDLKTVFDELGSARKICVGGPAYLGEELDYDCPHGRIGGGFVNTKNRPVLLQELHLAVGEPLSSEKEQAEDLRYVTVSAIRGGVAGVCPWSWTRQLRLWQDTFEHHHSFPMEKWDDRLGLNTHDDGTLKVAGQVFKDIAMLLRTIDFVSYDAQTRTVKTAQGFLITRLADDGENISNAIYHANKTACFAAMDMEAISFGGETLIRGPQGAYVYFFANGGDFHSSGELYVKSESAGMLAVARTGVVKAEL